MSENESKECKNVRFFKGNDNLVICQTGHADFNEILLMGKFTDIFSLPKQTNLEYLKKNLTFLRIIF